MKRKGFTFIEVLVVITIIAVLVVVGVVAYGSVNKRSRDARRKSDIEQMRSALEMYRADNGWYPDGGPTTTFTSISDPSLGSFNTELSAYIAKLPLDPLDDTNFPYMILMTDGRPVAAPVHYYGYCLVASLESGITDRLTEPGTDANAFENECAVDLDTSYTYGKKNP